MDSSHLGRGSGDGDGDGDGEWSSQLPSCHHTTHNKGFFAAAYTPGLRSNKSYRVTDPSSCWPVLRQIRMHKNVVPWPASREVT
ncbi:uncharacterized protein BDCG_16221 [Blastomyces dermatitidis ER-3]|uniref:Uncharacterized protein n=2 Tax=Ajellomyces dermatitidis TaxID=5039 RepID=A0A0J9EM25_AJEDA|nr:uncharacterized protein BDCG_16221 [Blastomyces dermatitidis ER-3]KMW67131.1 hypothetical protein BDDG_11933 [Blastomyces dermatitidis ATCC 18188]OAS99599.1 hypothetical protein BDCG_16221 [Blastomyces dermatitidis ER-3]